MNKFYQPDLAALLLRVGLGVMALAHGLLKVLVFTPEGTVGFFASMGLPAILAYLTIFIEVVGGIALIIGACSRWVSASMVPILLGATFLAHWQAGWLFSNQGGGWEFPMFWTLALVVQFFLGNGRYAAPLPGNK
ncbi:DoxX family protein [Teredinibacter sp. KSP-S5-2]|uniref:DoxX family protein n=1 Tax=Teredinibacter sp. KSP-S5-2 TaxID=3034506 RepID=UPI0029342CF8|nr:DoxX family protein [Teredinibacter sp. KSP-S5-2]WNO08340.1 DoxX family protein [Teredinibacter sp. KSP-S5-2]